MLAATHLMGQNIEYEDTFYKLKRRPKAARLPNLFFNDRVFYREIPCPAASIPLIFSSSASMLRPVSRFAST